MSDVLKSVFPPSFISKLRPNEIDVRRHLHHIFVDVDEWSRKQRRTLRRLLRLADRYGQLTLDTTRRLQSPNPVSFWGKLNELIVADLLDRANVKLTFNPPDRGSHEGEFIAAFKEDVFVEVKTMFPQPADVQQERYLKLLCAAAERLHFPAWIMLRISELPDTDFRSRPFVEFLARELPALANQSGTRIDEHMDSSDDSDYIETPEDSDTVEYKDEKSGLRVLISYGAELVSGPVSASSSTGVKVLTDRESAETSIKKAYAQLPDGMHTLVILCSQLLLPPSPRLIRDALYGTTQWLVKTADLRSGKEQLSAEKTLKDDGLFARCARKRMSAVGIVDELTSKYNLQPELVVHHHPCPDKPIDPEWLKPVTTRQEVVKRTVGPRGASLSISRPFDPPWPKWDGEGEDDGD